MKKILVFAILLVLFLVSCEDNSFINDTNGELTKMISETVVCPEVDETTLIRLYDIKNQYSSVGIYECSPKNIEKTYIAGYLSKDTIKYVNEIDATSPMGFDWGVEGINGNLSQYLNVAVWEEMIEPAEYPFTFKEFTSNEIPLKINKLELVFVIQKNVFNAKNILTEEEQSIDIYTNVTGEIVDKNYQVSKEELKFDNFLIELDKFTSCFVTNDLKRIVLIEDYNGVSSIKESCNYIIFRNDGLEYYNNVKDLIISDNKELKENEYFIYDYQKVIKFLKGE